MLIGLILKYIFAKLRPMVPKLAPWPRKVLVTKLLGTKRKNTSFYVIDQRYEAETMLIGLSTPKYPHFDILHAKIRPMVPKLAPWPRKVLVTKFLGKKCKNTSQTRNRKLKPYSLDSAPKTTPILTYYMSKSNQWFKSQLLGHGKSC